MENSCKLLLVLTLSTLVKSEDNCNGCLPPKYIDHYEAQGCLPVQKPGCSNCVTRYECSSRNDTDLSKCFYGGRYYEAGQKIENLGPCEECLCVKFPGGRRAEVICAQIECPENMIGIERMLQYSNTTVTDPDKCYLVYEPNKCCGKVRCQERPNEDPAPVCTVGEKSYREGDQIYLADCYSCVCKPGFNASKIEDNPFCHRVSCHFNLDLLRAGCAPVYVGDGCCAIDHHCPKPRLQERQRTCNDRIYEGFCPMTVKYKFNSTLNKCVPFNSSACALNPAFDTEESCTSYCTGTDLVVPAMPEVGKCYFDGVNYDVGSVLQTNSQYECSCRIPPTFTCIIPINKQ